MDVDKALRYVRELDTSLADPATLSSYKQFLSIMRDAIERFGLRRSDAERLAACEVFGGLLSNGR